MKFCFRSKKLFFGLLNHVLKVFHLSVAILLYESIIMYICLSVSVKFGPQLVPWTVVELAEDSSFDALFLKIQARAFDIISVSDNFRKTILLQALAGWMKESLNVVSTTTSVLGVY